MKTHPTSERVEGCSGKWLERIKEVLLLNGIDIQFVISIKNVLIHGRGKIATS